MTFESRLENNRLRPYVREQFEVKPLRRATDVGTIPHALHIECKDGKPTSLIMEYFSIERVSAIDRDERSIAAARANPALVGVDFSVGDVRSLSFEDSGFDAVFDLAELHNYADWERGLSEIARVLKAGGLLILEELSLESFTHGAGRLFRVLTEHPYDVMLTANTFRDSVLKNRFEILHFEERNPLGLLRYFTMIARKA
jgi:ubiquinone/menaquinone biosynthesis C-methylase UbiE